MLAPHIVAIVASIASIAVAAPAAQDNTGCTKCVDYVNDCGQSYGGCYNTCAGQVPTFAVPKCPCDDDSSDGIKRPDDCPKPQPGEVCKWLYNKCGTRYGGCYPEAGPVPSWQEPGCV
ncbi:hypothetical protein DOTSEDRAFT_35785 [Dothistroma septosporum NZE10]|uniref:Uncharacterized protein n=1 Tax=Dothistroma septosporum (strain NZE10 / CBS 128990) TaxID=675120 RepID=M2Y5M2_DOTSN|nr:hypothetical protein DOTSEDRAFT_35785 [Dothistroma septosporum NZE10]